MSVKPPGALVFTVCIEGQSLPDTQRCPFVCPYSVGMTSNLSHYSWVNNVWAIIGKFVVILCQEQYEDMNEHMLISNHLQGLTACTD